MARLLDISPLVHPGIAVWPGDVAYRRDLTCQLAEGASIDLSSITTTVHVGAHTDAPSHYALGGEGMHERSLDRYYGPCQVVRVEVARGARILPADVTVPITAPRVLFHTGTFPDPNQFNEDFASLSPELIRWLHEAHGVVLVGIDTPSIDPCHDASLLSHQAVAEADLAILEGVVLDDVRAGTYTLSAFPLRLHGADASPVRAVLIDTRGNFETQVTYRRRRKR
jgi:arylformamidase